MNKIFSLILIFLISSCSSIAFWASDEVDPDEPRKLLDFNERFEFIENWQSKFKGENTLNNFVPAFAGKNLFFVDPEGNVSSIDVESGEALWEYDLETEVSSGIVARFGKLHSRIKSRTSPQADFETCGKPENTFGGALLHLPLTEGPLSKGPLSEGALHSRGMRLEEVSEEADVEALAAAEGLELRRGNLT